MLLNDLAIESILHLLIFAYIFKKRIESTFIRIFCGYLNINSNFIHKLIISYIVTVKQIYHSISSCAKINCNILIIKSVNLTF